MVQSWVEYFNFLKGESTGPKDDNECDETEEATGSATHSRRKRQGPLIEDTVIGESSKSCYD